MSSSVAVTCTTTLSPTRGRGPTEGARRLVKGQPGRQGAAVAGLAGAEEERVASVWVTEGGHRVLVRMAHYGLLVCNRRRGGPPIGPQTQARLIPHCQRNRVPVQSVAGDV